MKHSQNGALLNCDGEQSRLAKCKDCEGLFNAFSMQGQWCEDCFDKGLIKDMDDHFRRTIESELNEPTPKREES